MPTISRKTQDASLTAAGSFSDQAAATAHQAIRSTQHLANQTLERMDDSVERARERATPALDRWARQAEEAARSRMETMRDKALLAREVTTTRIQDDPLKAVMIAAAAGAVLVGLFGLLRGRD